MIELLLAVYFNIVRRANSQELVNTYLSHILIFYNSWYVDITRFLLLTQMNRGVATNSGLGGGGSGSNRDLFVS